MRGYYNEPKIYYTDKDCPKTSEEIAKHCHLKVEDIMLLYTSYFAKIAESFKKTYVEIESDFLDFCKESKIQIPSISKMIYLTNGSKGNEVRVLIKKHAYSRVYDYNIYSMVNYYYDLCLVKEPNKGQEVFDKFILWLLKKYHKDLYNQFPFDCYCDLWSIRNGDVNVIIPLSSRGAEFKVPISAITNKEFKQVLHTPITLVKNRKFRCFEQWQINDLFKTKQVKKLVEWFKANKKN